MNLPPVPPHHDPATQQWMERVAAELRKLGSTVEEQIAPATSGDESTTTTGGGSWGYETPVSLEDNTGGTEDAWTSLAAGAPSGAAQALIQFDVSGGTALVKFRKESGAAEIRAQCGSDTRYSWGPLPVDLDASGDFEYYVEAAAVSWEIFYCGSVGDPEA